MRGFTCLRAGEAALLAGADVEAGEDLDYFDLEDLGRLRRRVRRAIENTQRERELYLDIVLQYFEVLSITACIIDTYTSILSLVYTF